MSDNHAPRGRSKEQYARAQRAYMLHEYERAATLFAELADGCDLYAALGRYYAFESNLQLGLRRMKAGHFAAAISALSAAATFNPNSLKLPRYLACACARLGHFRQASRHSVREMSLMPQDADPRIRLALSLWLDDQQEHAMQCLRDGLVQFPDEQMWHLQLGILYAARERFEEAVESFRAALDLAPDQPEAHLHLALCFAAEGNLSSAVEHLQTAQRLQPHNSKTALYLAQAVDSLAQRVSLSPQIPTAMPLVDMDLIDELVRLINTEPDVIEAFLDQAAIDSDQDTYAVLCAVLDRVLLAQPHRAEFHYHRALLFRRMGHKAKAIHSCERAVEINPTLVQGLITLGKLYQETQRLPDAAARLRQVIDMGFEYADVYYTLGCTYRDQGRHRQALNSYRRALEINSNYRDARRALDALAA